jgi:chemotaxis protein histidine kinase CheA
MKGESRAFDLTELEAALEALEDVLAAIRKNAPALEDRDLVEDAAAAIRAGLFRAETAIDRARQDFVAVSPIGAAALEQATVQRSDLESVLTLARGRGDALGLAVEKLGARPFGEALATIAERVPEWAAREGKRVELVVEGREVRVPRALAELLPSVMTHLVRNAIAHGIEDPAARVEQGKPAVGTIWASIHTNGGASPEVEVEDDGGGIALEAVRTRASALGLDPDLPAADLIFAKGLSTRATSDGLAGRGVGLDAVRAYAHEAGYEVDVVSEPGKGTKFLVRPA